MVSEVVVAVRDVARAAPLRPREDEEAAHRVLVLRPARWVRHDRVAQDRRRRLRLMDGAVDSSPNAVGVIIVVLPESFFDFLVFNITGEVAYSDTGYSDTV